MAKKTRSPISETPEPTEDGRYAFEVDPKFVLGARAVVSAQLKGVDAVTAASQIAMEGALAVAECQCRILQEAWEFVLSSSGGLLTGGLPSGAVAAQAEWTRRASEKFLSDGRELAALAGQAQTDVLSVWRDQLVAMIDDIERLGLNRTE